MKKKGGELINMTKKTTIPQFDSIEEEEAFWDTQSAADFWDEMTPMKVRFARPLSKGLTVRFDATTLQHLRKTASKKGLAPTALIRMWVKEQLAA
jgi:predicted DNA binding CopG/RHH family protein